MMWPFKKKPIAASAEGATGVAKKEYEWPYCAPIDKTDPYWETNNNCNMNGVQYHKVECPDGRWKWDVNEHAMEWIRAREDEQLELARAFQSRLLTDEELARVMSYGSHIFVREMQAFYQRDVDAKFQAAMMFQNALRNKI